MRITLALLAPILGLAQPPAQPPVPVVPQLAAAARLINDFGNTHRYMSENAAVKPPAPGEDRVVFMGDSITDNWHNARFGGFFPGKPYLNRGISGQVTSQMLLRFYQDVVALQPKAMVFLGGTNDIGSNIGPMPLEATEAYIASMVDICLANKIKVVLASLTPIADLPGKNPMTPGRPPASVAALNAWIKDLCVKKGLTYLDYFTATADANGFFRAELTDDGLHPTAKGYEIMNPLAEKAIAQALGK